jgi:hypothetical protein
MMSPSAVAAGAAVGALAGAHAATWGAYKDSVYEGFSGWKYARSVCIAAPLGVLLAPVISPEVPSPATLVVLFGCVYVAERGIFELYKTFLRQEDQSKYHIPMQFHVLGRIVVGRAARALAGAAVLLALALLVLGVQALERAAPQVSPLAMSALVGLIAGLVSAIMGAWKDAPIEGFEPLKFLRSPAIAMGYGLLLAPYAHELLPTGAAALGYTVASIETYKTFIDGGPPGKFAGKPVRHPSALRTRWRLVPLFAAIWIAIVLTAMAGWPKDGLTWMLAQVGGR